MTFFQALILALVQGLTEFLPVSSSGHLVLFQKLFGFTSPPIFFDILLHLGTLFAVIIFFRKEIFFLVKNWKRKTDIWLALIIGSIPAGIFGFLVNSKIEKIFNSLTFVGVCWIITGSFLVLTKKFKTIKTEKLEEIKKPDALIVGLFQALAIFPGLSRSGLTIFGGLFRKFSPETAFSFSFLLSLPAILGAVLFESKNISLSQIDFFVSGVSLTTAAVVGYFSLKLLKKILASEKIFYFGYYCLFLGLVIFCLY